MHELTRKGQPFIRGERQQLAFERLKQCLVSAEVLATPTEEGRYILDTDASGHALGAVLQQQQDNGLRVIAYASRTLLPAEVAYCTTRLELQGVVYGLRKFRHYLLGREFTLRTDNAAVTSLLRTPEPLAQQARWLNLIAEYNFELVHRPGDQNRAADSLSRRPCERDNVEMRCKHCQPRGTVTGVSSEPLVEGSTTVHAREVHQETVRDQGSTNEDDAGEGGEESRQDTLPPLSNEVIAQEQRKGAVTGKLLKLLTDPLKSPIWEDVSDSDQETQQLFAQRGTLEVRDGILYRQYQKVDGSVEFYQVVVPRSLRTLFLAEAHGSKTSGHFGMRKCQERIKRYAYWYRWKTDVAYFVRRCEKCNRYKKGPTNPQGQLQYSSVNTAWQKVHVDLMGPFVRLYDGFEYILTAICSFTKYLIAVPLRNKKATTVAQALVKNVYLVHGTVELQVTDQGKEFCNSLMASIAQLLGVQRCRGTAYRPSSNGQIERVHATINRCFATTVDSDQRNWSDMVPYVSFAYNTSYHSSTTYSPFYLLYLREPNLAIDLMIDRPSPVLPNSTDEYAAVMAERMRKAYAVVNDQLKCSFSRAKRRYDLRVKELQLLAGDLVWYFSPRRRRYISPKWALQTSGPYRIVRKLNEVNYAIQWTPRRRPFIVHIDRLRPYEEPIPGNTGAAQEAGPAGQSETTTEASRRSETSEADDTRQTTRPIRVRRPPAKLRDYTCARVRYS
ncbi:MAG TPA: RNase H-like domain-containing protein, partial [Methylomicrobium sp.]|nr:RNase H-like domain-containing protein [Methylomicrobium sp.]